MGSVNTEFDLYGSINECTRNYTVFFSSFQIVLVLNFFVFFGKLAFPRQKLLSWKISLLYIVVELAGDGQWL